MGIELSSSARDILDSRHTAILATTNADGRPQSSIIFVARHGHDVWFSTLEERLKARNMRRDPRVSLLVVDQVTGRYAELRGWVTIDDDQDRSLLTEMYDRYMGGATPPDEPGSKRLAVRLQTERIYLWPPDPQTR